MATLDERLGDLETQFGPVAPGDLLDRVASMETAARATCSELGLNFPALPSGALLDRIGRLEIASVLIVDAR
jgi:hypothetical protein